MKLPDAPVAHAQASKSRNAAPRKVPIKTPIPESGPNAKLEKQLGAVIRVPDVSKPAFVAFPE